MTLYLTDDTTAEEVIRAKKSGVVHGVKYYPAGATTNSASGVTDLARCQAALEAMEEVNLPLLVHGEVTFAEVDLFDREKIFLDRTLAPLLGRHPRLRVVLEHITTKEAVRFVRGTPARVAATITAHHLLLNRNAMFSGGIRPHHYCRPILEARRASAGIDRRRDERESRSSSSAPTARRTRANDKEAACGCAGIFTAHAGIELYAEVFAAAGHSIASKASPASTDRSSTGCPRTATPSRWCGKPGRCRQSSRSVPARWCRCGAAAP